MQQGLETEQRRLAALAHEEERLVLLTLEESTASAALEQLRANALERERTQAEERALRDAVLRSRSEAEGQRREEERRRREEECEVLRVMAVSRRESEEGKGKGKGKVVVDEGEEAEREEEDELDRREREALELAMQLSLQEEEKRRIWRGGLSVANADDAPDAIVVAPSSGSAAPTFVAHPPAVDPHAASYFPTSSSSSAFPSGEDPADPAPPAYELAPHAHELDSPSDVIIGPGRPLPLPPAHAPARLRRPSVRQDIKAAYPSFAPYAREGDGGGGGRSGSVVPSESGGALSMAASAGSFEEEEVVAVGSSWSGVGAREGGQGGFVEEPERLGWGGEGLRIGEEEDPFDDRFGEEAEQQEEEDEGAGRLVTGEGDEARRDEQLQERDLFAEVLARRATQRLRSTEAYPARPVVAVDRVDPAAWTSADEARTTEDDQRTPTGPDPPALARVAQPVSAPSTPEPSSFLEPPASTPARIPSNSAPTSPTSSSSHLRSDPSSGGFVEDLGSLVPFADEHVLRDVRWGFVDDETSSAGRYPRLEHEGDFPRGAQLSAVRGADGAQAYRAFAVEARTWQGLLIFLMCASNPHCSSSEALTTDRPETLTRSLARAQGTATLASKPPPQTSRRTKPASVSASPSASTFSAPAARPRPPCRSGLHACASACRSFYLQRTRPSRRPRAARAPRAALRSRARRRSSPSRPPCGSSSPRSRSCPSRSPTSRRCCPGRTRRRGATCGSRARARARARRRWRRRRRRGWEEGEGVHRSAPSRRGASSSRRRWTSSAGSTGRRSRAGTCTGAGVEAGRRKRRR